MDKRDFIHFLEREIVWFAIIPIVIIVILSFFCTTSHWLTSKSYIADWIQAVALIVLIVELYIRDFQVRIHHNLDWKFKYDLIHNNINIYSRAGKDIHDTIIFSQPMYRYTSDNHSYNIPVLNKIKDKSFKLKNDGQSHTFNIKLPQSDISNAISYGDTKCKTYFKKKNFKLQSNRNSYIELKASDEFKTEIINLDANGNLCSSEASVNGLP